MAGREGTPAGVPYCLTALATGAFMGLEPALGAAGFAPGAKPRLLIGLGEEAAIARAQEFAEALPPGQEALVVNILTMSDPNDSADLGTHLGAQWEAAREAALLWAFTRHAALAWASRAIRVNAIGLGISPLLAAQPAEASGQPAGAAPALPATMQDIAATLRAMWGWRSMTGQLIRLGRL